MNSPQRDFNPLRAKNDIENHNLTIADDLLSSLNNWRPEQDIIRLTFKAVLDILKSQASTIKSIELDLPTKALKSDFSQLLHLKSGQNDLLRSVNDLKNSLESKVSSDEVYTLLNDKVSKSELSYQLSCKATYEELRSQYCEKSDLRDLHSEIRLLRSEFSQVNEENFVRSQNNSNEIEEILHEIQSKVSREEFEQALEEKANKQSVANALHRKANKADMESALNEKVDNTEYLRLSDTLSTFQQDLIEQVDLIREEIDKKVGKNEYEETLNSLHVLRKEQENKSFNHFSSLEGFVASVKSELEELASKFQSSSSSTLEQLSTKISFNDHQDCTARTKREFFEDLSGLRAELARFQDLVLERNSKLELCCKGIQDEVLQTRLDLKSTNEQVKLVHERSKESVEEGLKSYQNFMATSLEEIKKVQVSFESLKHDVEDLDLKKIDKLDARKLIDGKVEVRELQENLDRVCKELVKMNLAKFEEIRELVNRKEKELILLIDSKPGVHEVNSLILDQNLASVRKSYFNEAQEDRYMRSNELKDSYNNQYLDLFNSKHH